jgi:hypothetical protein
MDPLGLGPTDGPDPACPGAWFESGGHWYVIGVFPVRLSHGFALSLGVSNKPIWGVFYEDLLGAAAARVDRRHKLVVWRKQPPLLGGSGWLIVHVEIHPDQESADDRRTEMVAGWDPRLFADGPAISAREVRRTLRDARAARAPDR